MRAGYLPPDQHMLFFTEKPSKMIIGLPALRFHILAVFWWLYQKYMTALRITYVSVPAFQEHCEIIVQREDGDSYRKEYLVGTSVVLNQGFKRGHKLKQAIVFCGFIINDAVSNLVVI